MRIEKKTWPEYFEKIRSGEKTFEMRIADFACSPGDIMVLREWDPKTKAYTGRVLEKEVTYVMNTKNNTFFPKEQVDKFGLYMISIK
jgi:ASC-1-like (ASCH) protein